MSMSFSILLIQALHVLLVLADPFNITVIEEGATGSTVSYRVWYGDGQAYVGSKVPDTVEQAVDITSSGIVNEVLYVEATSTGTGTSTSAAGLPQSSAGPYFMAINTSPAASDPIYFTASLSALPVPDADADALVHLWAAYGGYLLPVTDAGRLLSAPLGGGAYLVPAAGAPGTYSLRWIMDAGVAAGLDGATKVLLSSLPVTAAASP